MGFFTASSLPVFSPKTGTGPECGQCGQYKLCGDHPKQFSPTLGQDRVLVVYNAPADHPDGHARPPEALRQTLGRLDLLHETDFLGVVACPVDKATIKEAAHCRPWFVKQLEAAKPRVVIPIGQEAISSTIGHLWGVEAGRARKWAGRKIPDQTLNAWVCPIATGDAAVAEIDKLWFNIHLREAAQVAETGKRPWKVVPDFKSKIRIIYDHREAAEIIRRITREAPAAIAFDYECTGLKPELEAHKIYTCSIAWGDGRWPDDCIAYPWVGEAVEATSELLRSPVPKIAQNAKFEERWTIRKLGHRVRNWIWCTQLGAHWEDPTEETKGLEIQAYNSLGFRQWASSITPFLEADGANAFNQIQKAPLGDLLLYNGLDSYLEYAIAWKQWKRNGLSYQDLLELGRRQISETPQ